MELATYQEYVCTENGPVAGVDPPSRTVTTFGVVDGGEEVASADELGQTDKRIYDSDERQTEEAGALGANSTFGYDGEGNLTGVTDPLATPTLYDHDAEANETTRTYNNDGTQTQTTEAYNEAGDVSVALDQFETTPTLTNYGLSGKETTVTQPNGTSITTTYNAQGEPAAVEATVGTVNPVKEVIAYDALGNATSSTVTTSTATPVAGTAAEYDAKGNMTSLADRKGVEMTFEHDDEDNLAGVSDSVGGASKAVGYAYDANSTVTSITFGQSSLTVFGFDSARRRTSQSSLSGNLVTSMAYDAASKITSMTTSYSSTQLAHYEYGYDQGARIISATEGSATTSYAYDDLNRLILVANPDSSTVAYAYDDLGNRLSKKRSGEASTTYEYDEANQLTSEARPDAEYITYSYDANGNLVFESSAFGGITTYSYDAENRLAKVIRPNGDSAEFVYDGNDNRYEKRSIPASGTATSTFYAYDADGNIALEYDANNIVKVRYIRDSGTGKALAMEQAGSVYRFIYNEHGDVRKVVNSSGQVVATYSYDEFGNETSSTGTLYSPLRYSGANNAYFDSETGLYKMGARYYKPEVGRWITRDPWLGFQEDPLGQNEYTYVKGNPVNRKDETGFWDTNRAATAGKSYYTEATRWKNHREATEKFAKLHHIKYASAMGEGSMKGDKGGYNGWGGTGDPWWHSDMGSSTSYATDTRYKSFVRMRKWAIYYVKSGRGRTGALVLGLGLHAYPQDYMAHGWVLSGETQTFPGKADNPRWKGMPDSWQGAHGHTGWPGYPQRWKRTYTWSLEEMRRFKRKCGRAYPG